MVRSYPQGARRPDPSRGTPISTYLEGQVLSALGRFKAVAAMFDSIRRAALPPLPAIIRGVFDGATWT